MQHAIRIERDELAESPREWDNLGTCFFLHARYELGDEGAKDPRKMNPDDILAQLPVYMYEHGGITLSTTPFSCPWDSGQLGMIYITKSQAEECPRQADETETEYVIRLKRILDAEIQTLDDYVCGDCYRFEVIEYDAQRDPEAHYGDATDSCGGFLGRNPHENGLIENIGQELHHFFDDVTSLEERLYL